ncbi:MAG: NfeD family protein [Clostridia bacterium]
MVPWQIWLIIAGVCLIIEIVTVGFFVFWFAIAALITALLSLFIHNIIAQATIFIIISVILIFLTKPLTDKITKKDKVSTNVNALIGQEGTVIKEINSGSNKIGQVKILGDTWSAVTTNDFTNAIPVGSNVKILKIDGVNLIVEPVYSISESAK